MDILSIIRSSPYSKYMYPGPDLFVDPTGLTGAQRKFSTIDDALTVAKQENEAFGLGCNVFVCPGDYDEAVSISGLQQTFIMGIGPYGVCNIAPSDDDLTGLTIEGTAATRARDIVIANMGIAGTGTGGGLYVKGNVRRIRTFGCKIEGGAVAAKMESTAAGSVGDCSIEEGEICWSTDGLNLVVSGGGDPVTQFLLKKNRIHNIVTDCVENSGAHTADLWILDNDFANQEDGTEPTQYLDIDEASTTGMVAGNRFATTVFASAKMAIAAGVIWLDNKVQGENPGTANYGASGRPD